MNLYNFVTLCRATTLGLILLTSACGSQKDEKPKATATAGSAAAAVKVNPDALSPAAIALLESENQTLETERVKLTEGIKTLDKQREEAGKIIKGDGLGGILGTILSTVLAGPNVIENIANALTNKDGKKAIELIDQRKAEVAAKIKVNEDKIKANNEKIAKAKAAI